MEPSLVKKTEITAVGVRCSDHATPLYPQKVGTNFADNQFTDGSEVVSLTRFTPQEDSE
jgi:FAD/FMN-containing dehydrogenase